MENLNPFYKWTGGKRKEIKFFESALRRRQLRLILSGKMKPDDATELKALFVKDLIH